MNASDALVDRIVARGSPPTLGELAAFRMMREREEAVLERFRNEWRAYRAGVQHGPMFVEYSIVPVPADPRCL